MTSYVTPKKNTAFKFYVALVDQSNTKLTKANPTIASGDFKVSTDGGAFANLATLPSANPASGRAVMIDLSNTEMNGDNIVVQCVDAAGAEWCDLILNIQTTARQIDDLAYPATSGRSMVVDASGLVDANMVKAGPTGSGTAQTAGDIYGLNVTIASYIDTEVAAIKAQTDKLTFTVANQVDCNVLDWKSSAAPAMTGDAFARLGAPVGASISADVAGVPDALLGRNVAGGSSSGRLVKEALYMLRNKWTVSGGTLTVYGVDDTTIVWTASMTSDAAAVPVTGSDPA